MLINFLTFFQGLRLYSGLHRAYLSSKRIRYKWGYAYSFCQIFQGLCLFKGVRLFQTLEYLQFIQCDYSQSYDYSTPRFQSSLYLVLTQSLVRQRQIIFKMATVTHKGGNDFIIPDESKERIQKSLASLSEVFHSK